MWSSNLICHGWLERDRQEGHDKDFESSASHRIPWRDLRQRGASWTKRRPGSGTPGQGPSPEGTAGAAEVSLADAISRNGSQADGEALDLLDCYLDPRRDPVGQRQVSTASRPPSYRRKRRSSASPRRPGAADGDLAQPAHDRDLPPADLSAHQRFARSTFPLPGCVLPPVRREALVDRVEVRDLDRGSVAAGLRSWGPPVSGGAGAGGKRP